MAGEPTAPVPPSPGTVTLYNRETNAPVVVDAADAPKHILSGELNYAPGTKIPVKIKGQVGTVDADELGDAFKSGATPISSKDFHQSELKAEYGSTPQAALAFGVNALDSATIGASNAIIGGLGGQKTREYLRNVTEANPAASTAGDVAGFVAPIAADVLSGGALTPGLAAAEAARAGEKGLLRATAETAGKALLAPTRAVSAIGDVAESAARAVVGKGADSATARLAQNIIAGGARGVIEGGLYGVGGEVGHQYLQDNPELTGEALGTAWAHGALLGGVLGGGLHGVGGLLTRKASSVERAAAAEEGALASGEPYRSAATAVEHAETKALPGAAPESTVADKAADAIISQVDDPSTAKTLAEAWKNRAKAFSKHEDLLDDATRKIVKSLDETLEAGHTVDMASFGESKSNQMAKLVPAENLKPARDSALKVWADAKAVIDDLNTYATKGGAEGSVKRLGKWLEDFGNVPKHEWNDPAQLFDKVDDFKRAVGREAGFGKGDFGRAEATDAFNKLYDRIRLSLEDQTTWGAAAVAQREINAATADMLSTGRKFAGNFTTDYGSRAISGAPKPVASPDAVSSFVNSLNSPKNDLKLQMFADYSRKRAAYLEAVSRNYALDATAKKAVSAELAAHKAMTATIGDTAKEVASINQLKRLMAEEKGHAIGGIIGFAIDAVTKPGHSLARLAELEATKNRALAKIDKGVAAVKSAMSGSGERRKPGLAPKLEGPDSYEKRRASILAAASKSDEAHAHIEGAASPIAPHAPATASAMMRAGLRTIQYLMTAMPKPPQRSGSSLTPQLDMEAWQPSDAEKDQFNRKWDAAMHPEHVLSLVANGTITAQHVEALRASRPAMYADMTTKLQADLDRRTKPVPLDMQGPLKTFLGIPQMDPEIQKLISAPSPEQLPQQKLNRPLKMADTTTLNATKE